MGMHLGYIFSLEQDLSFCYHIIGKTHDGHEEGRLARSVRTKEHVSLPLSNREADVVQHLLVPDIN
jgi:hypothetical protein